MLNVFPESGWPIFATILEQELPDPSTAGLRGERFLGVYKPWVLCVYNVDENNVRYNRAV